jgi:hypothetical protein
MLDDVRHSDCRSRVATPSRLRLQSDHSYRQYEERIEIRAGVAYEVSYAGKPRRQLPDLLDDLIPILSLATGLGQGPAEEPASAALPESTTATLDGNTAPQVSQNAATCTYPPSAALGALRLLL